MKVLNVNEIKEVTGGCQCFCMDIQQSLGEMSLVACALRCQGVGGGMRSCN